MNDQYSDLGSHYTACEEQEEGKECICEDIMQVRMDAVISAQINDEIENQYR